MPFADEMIGTSAAQHLAQAVASAMPDAPLPRLRRAPDEITGLPLRQRVDVLQAALLADIPGSYADLAQVVRTVLDGPVPFSGWEVWPVTTAVATKAVDEGGRAAFDDAMALLARLTQLLTSEFAVRTLINYDPDRALEVMSSWARSQNEDVRRLASEGTRPYLPWAIRVTALTQRAGATVPILDELYRDPSEYVRRSIANHLNDLSRDHSDLVVQTATRWLADPDTNTAWVVRHGLRTLVKRGHPGALALLGFAPSVSSLTIDGPHVDHEVVMAGHSIELRASIRNDGDTTVHLMVDYVIHHFKANGQQTPKTFKLTTATLNPGESVNLRREHSFRVITTRRYYAGPHAVSLQINGVQTAPTEFELVGADPSIRL